ncbi:MAG: DeoR/GlpR family DNA-binding transcription regulator [Chloroflexota bacterium]
MLSAQRRRSILEDIESGIGSIALLSKKYNVSEMTIRRDLKVLEQEGRVQRTHGGAVVVQPAGVEPRYAAKQKVNAALKARIARYAAEELVQNGDIILLEGGTTVTAMARYLRGKQNLTVVTNGLYTTNELRHLLPYATIICTGGILRDVSFTFVGPSTEEFFRAFHGHKLFISATGLTLDAGFTDPNLLETQVRRAMIGAVDQVIALVDSSKFGVKSLTGVVPADGVSILVTDSGAPPDMVAELRARGVDVRVVP